MRGVRPGPPRLYPSLSWLQHPNPGNWTGTPFLWGRPLEGMLCHPDGLSEREVPGEGPRGARATRRGGRGCRRPQQRSPEAEGPREPQNKEVRCGTPDQRPRGLQHPPARRAPGALAAHLPSPLHFPFRFLAPHKLPPLLPPAASHRPFSLRSKTLAVHPLRHMACDRRTAGRDPT